MYHHPGGFLQLGAGRCASEGRACTAGAMGSPGPLIGKIARWAGWGGSLQAKLQASSQLAPCQLPRRRRQSSLTLSSRMTKASSLHRRLTLLHSDIGQLLHLPQSAIGFEISLHYRATRATLWQSDALESMLLQAHLTSPRSVSRSHDTPSLGLPLARNFHDQDPSAGLNALFDRSSSARGLQPRSRSASWRRSSAVTSSQEERTQA